MKSRSRSMRFLVGLLAPIGWLLWPGLPTAAPPNFEGLPPPKEKEADAGPIKPFLHKYCIKCHGPAKPKGGLNIATRMEDGGVAKREADWERIVRNVRSGDMPQGKLKPTPDEIGRFTSWVDEQLARAAASKRDPGRVVMRRLNRTEYANTIRDLLRISFQPEADLPADDGDKGFDNNAAALSLSPVLLERYLATAEQAVDLAWQSTESRKRLLITPPAGGSKKDWARRAIAHFVRRAYRRPAGNDEVERLLRLAGIGDDFEKGLRRAFQAVLVSPHFLYLVELDSESAGPGAIDPLNEFQLASRLSYFLWSSMPDDELLAEADKGTLRVNLAVQVARMLQDPRSRALAANFAGQWLDIRSLGTLSPSQRKAFPQFDEALRDAMVRETELFFTAILRENRSVSAFLDADFTFVNERLARHYGLEGVRGEHWRRVRLPAGERGGLLTQASVLTVTSNPDRTSPVKRGKWILENILGEPPPPPPPGVSELASGKQSAPGGSLRQRMERHRSDARCASCHQRMDPLGFGLENFDGIGAWRTDEARFPIDASGTLPGGQTFQGARQLKAILKKRLPDFSRCLTEKMLTYALGRGLERSDKRYVEEVRAALAADNYRFATLVLAITRSEPFQMRRGERRGP